MEEVGGGAEARAARERGGVAQFVEIQTGRAQHYGEDVVAQDGDKGGGEGDGEEDP